MALHHFKEVNTGQVVEIDDEKQPDRMDFFTTTARWQRTEKPAEEKPAPKRTTRKTAKAKADDTTIAAADATE